jgi:outer membrane protein TolC
MEAQTDSVRNTVMGNLKIAYFRLAYIQETVGVLQKSDDLLNQVQQATEARYRVGQGIQQDVLKAQLQHTKILKEIAHHHQEEGVLEAQIKELLGRAQESPDIIADALFLRTLPLNATELLQRTRESNPDIRARQAAFVSKTRKSNSPARIFVPISTCSTHTNTPQVSSAITTWPVSASGYPIEGAKEPN